MCLNGFSREHVFEGPKKRCTRVKERQAWIIILEKGKNILKYKNKIKITCSRHMLFMQILSLVKNVKTTTEMDDGKGSYTKETSTREACGHAYKIVRSDGLCQKREFTF